MPCYRRKGGGACWSQLWICREPDDIPLPPVRPPPSNAWEAVTSPMQVYPAYTTLSPRKRKPNSFIDPSRRPSCIRKQGRAEHNFVISAKGLDTLRQASGHRFEAGPDNGYKRDSCLRWASTSVTHDGDSERANHDTTFALFCPI